MATDDRLPDLDELRGELESLGMIVVPFRDEIQIRRSTLEYIKVRVDDGVLRCEPWIGVLSQAKATWALLAAEMAAVAALRNQWSTTGSMGLALALAGLLAFGLHALRYTLAEITISRVQAVWLDLRARHRLAGTSSPETLAAPPTPALPGAALPEPEQFRPKRANAHVGTP